MINIPTKLIEIVRAQGERAYPNECCGIIYGSFGEAGKTATELEPIANSFDDDERYHRFLITSETLLKAEMKARKLKLDIIGFYHSHPDCPAEPSDYDREHALPFYSYIIVSVNEGAAADVKSWELTEDRSCFTQEEIQT